MTKQARTTHKPAGGDGLLFLIAMAVIAVVTVEGLFIAFASWWFMTLVLFVVILAAIGVSTALVRLMEDDTPIAAPRQKAAAPAERPAPAPLPRPIAH